MKNSERWAWADIDLQAYRHNIGVLRELSTPSAVWAVVKANAYGHGAVPVSRVAVDAGVAGLCVATTSEGVELREAGIAAPILVFSQQPPHEIDELLRHDISPTVYDEAYVDALVASAQTWGLRNIGVHVKVDTGMHRVGVSPQRVNSLLTYIASQSPTIVLAGIYTHFATADDPSHSAGNKQRQIFADVLQGDVLKGVISENTGIAIHAVNSAGALTMPSERRSFIRSGIATYGIEPGPLVATHCTQLKPVMSLKARVSHIQIVEPGEGISYGQRHVFTERTLVATIPIGYADGVPRRLWSEGGYVLIGGIRRPIVGVVTMDQMMVDCGTVVDIAEGAQVKVGDEVVLIGTQGDEQIRAEDWAAALGTIAYEITCGIGERVPRRYGETHH